MMFKNPFFSIVFVIGQETEIVHHSLLSILNQKYKNFEAIVINNSGVKFSQKNIIKSLKNKKIRFFQFKKKKEVFYARNFGISKSKSKYISILDSDDFFSENHLKQAHKIFLKDKTDFYYTSFKNLNLKTNRFKSRKCPQKLKLFDLLTYCPIGHSTVIYKKKLINNYFPVKYRHDFATWSKLLPLNNVRISMNPSFNVIRTIHEKNFTKNKMKLISYYLLIYRKYFKLNYAEIFYYFTFLIIRHLFANLSLSKIIEKPILKKRYYSLHSYLNTLVSSK